MLIHVILPLPIKDKFTYEVPDDIPESIGLGTRVLV